MSNYPRRHRRRRHRQSPLTILFFLVLGLAALVIVVTVITRLFSPNSQPSPTPTPTPTATVSPEPTASPDPSPSPTQSLPYDFSKPVPESSSVDKSYLDDAVFLGDSRTEGLVLYTGLSNATSYAKKGLMVDTVFTTLSVELNGQTMTVMEAMKHTQFSKVYLMFGINELGWAYPSIFIDKFTQIIEEIRAINPDAIIYVQEILPVSQKVSDTHSYISNEKIQEFNQLILDMTQEQEVYYLQVSQAFIEDDNFCLPDGASSDGIHLSPSYCQKWLDYLLCHTVNP